MNNSSLHISLDERKKIENFLSSGMSLNKISIALGRARNTINFELKRAGGREGYTAEKAQQAFEDRCRTNILASKTRSDEMRNIESKLFKFEEREQIQKLISQGLSASAIARKIGRSKNGVIVEIRKNGGREKYNASLAQENRVVVWGESIHRRQQRINDYSSIKYLLEQVKSLQEQINIIFELLNNKG
mgnify:FL=1